MDSKTVEELRGLAEKATPGPWHYAEREGRFLFKIMSASVYVAETSWHDASPIYPTKVGSEANFALIVAMRNALPALLDALSASLAREGEDWIGTAQQGFKAWKAKPHNARWFRKIDGTPIPNDLTICIGEAFAARIRALAAENEALRKGRREEELREDARLGAALARAESSESLVTELREKVERLTKALEPFAKRAERYDPDEADDGEPDWSTASPSIRIGDLRRARSELEGRDD